LSDVCLSVCLSDVCLLRIKSGLTREQRGRKTKIGSEVAHVTRDSDQGQKVKGQLVADVLNSQHAEFEDIVMPEQHRHLANKYENIVNLQGTEVYCMHSLL